MRALRYATRDRQARKREMRALWIQRINAATRAEGLSYSRFINGLKAAKVDLDRKMLAHLAAEDGATFLSLINLAKENSEANLRAA